MFKLIKKLLFGVKVREYVNIHYVALIKAPGDYYFTSKQHHVVYKCYNTKHPSDFWYEAEANGIVQKIQTDLYIHGERLSKA